MIKTKRFISVFYIREDKNVKESMTQIFKERICECRTTICLKLDVLIKRTEKLSLQLLRMPRSPANCSLQDRSFLKTNSQLFNNTEVCLIVCNAKFQNVAA